MITRKSIAPVVLFPFLLPAIIAFKTLNQDASSKVRKDTTMYWTHTIGQENKHFFQMWLVLMSINRTFRNVFYTRVSNFWRIILPYFLKPHSSLNINPSLSKCYGGGLYIAHGESCRIEPDMIGENSWIHQNVTIGMKGAYRPVIGNNVYIGCGAVIIGRTRIGDNVRIGANAVIVDMEIPSNSTVCGPKAQIVRKR